MKWRLPGRGSGTGTYGRTLNLLSSDPCPAAVPRTLRAGRAPGTDRAPSGCSSASPPPPRLQLRPKGLHSFCLRRLEVFAQVCRQNSRLGSQRFPFRASQYAGNGGGGGSPATPQTPAAAPAPLPSRGTGSRGAAALRRQTRAGSPHLRTEDRSHPHSRRESHHSSFRRGTGGAARGAPETRGCKEVPRPELRGTTRLPWPWAPRSHILSPRRVFLF